MPNKATGKLAATAALIEVNLAFGQCGDIRLFKWLVLRVGGKVYIRESDSNTAGKPYIGTSIS